MKEILGITGDWTMPAGSADPNITREDNESSETSTDKIKNGKHDESASSKEKKAKSDKKKNRKEKGEKSKKVKA